MSISSTANRNNYTGTSLVNVYAYAFKILDDDDLRVIVRNLSGVETVLTKTTHYTVSGVNAVGGGNVTLVNGVFAWLTAGFLTTGFKITLRRVVSLVQNTDIRNQGEYFPELHEDSFDRTVMIDQQQQDSIDRSIRASETETLVLNDLPDVATRASQFLGFDGFGQIAVGQPTSAIVSAFMQTVLDDTTAAAARTTLGIDGVSGNIALGDLAAALQAFLVPTGVVLDFAGSVAPTAFELCDGGIVDSVNPVYAPLFAKIGHVWDTFNGQASPGGTLFRRPKLNGMTTVAAGAAQAGTVATSLRALAGVLGSETKTLIEANLPLHQHSTPALTHTVNNGSVPTDNHVHQAGTLMAQVFWNTADADNCEALAINGDAYVANRVIDVQLVTVGAGTVNPVSTGTGVSGNTNTPSATTTVTVDSHGAGTTGNGNGVSTPLSVIQPSAVMNKIIKL